MAFMNFSPLLSSLLGRFNSNTSLSNLVANATSAISHAVETHHFFDMSSLSSITGASTLAAPTLTVTSGAAKTPVVAGSTITDQAPAISGTGVAGTTVTVLDNGHKLATALVDATGNWSITSSIKVGANEGHLQNHTLVAVATNSTGAHSDPTSTTSKITFAEAGTDLSSVVAANAATLAASTVVVTDNVGTTTGAIAAGATTDDTAPVVSGHYAGTVAAGLIVTVFDNGRPIGTTTVGADGNWSLATSKSTFGFGDLRHDQAHTIAAVVGDGSGHISTPATLSFVEAGTWTAPIGHVATLTAPTLVVTDHVGATTGALTAGGTTDDPVPTITGTYAAPAGSTATTTITVLDNGHILGTTSVAADGTWSLANTNSLTGSAATSHTLSAIATDNAGHFSPVTKLSFTETTLALAAPTFTATDNVGSTTGTITNGAVTDDLAPTVSGTYAVTGDTITLYDNGTKLASTTVGADGKWTVALSSSNLTLSDVTHGGVHQLTAVASDSTGNTSAHCGSSAASLYLVEQSQASTALTSFLAAHPTLGANVANIAGMLDHVIGWH